MTCEQELTLATNIAQKAYAETKNHIELVDQVGLFDAWMSITSALMDKDTDPNHRELLGTMKMAQKTLAGEKQRIVKTIAQEAYPKLLGRVTFRTCDYAEQQGWRNE